MATMANTRPMSAPPRRANASAAAQEEANVKVILRCRYVKRGRVLITRFYSEDPPHHERCVGVGSHGKAPWGTAGEREGSERVGERREGMCGGGGRDSTRAWRRPRLGPLPG